MNLPPEIWRKIQSYHDPCCDQPIFRGRSRALPWSEKLKMVQNPNYRMTCRIPKIVRHWCPSVSAQDKKKCRQTLNLCLNRGPIRLPGVKYYNQDTFYIPETSIWDFDINIGRNNVFKLKILCEYLGIKDCSRMRKSQLIQVIQSKISP